MNLSTLDSFAPSAPSWWPDQVDSEGNKVKEAPKGYWLGVDDTGRDQFVRIAYGARVSLQVAFTATGISLVIGVLLGLSAGFYRGKIDTVISRATDVVLALPILLLALGIASACGANQEGCFWGSSTRARTRDPDHRLFGWPYIARIVRAADPLAPREGVHRGVTIAGAGNRRIILRELLPNVAAPIIVYTTLIIPSNILFEAGLSFLGVGVPDTTPSWGACSPTPEPLSPSRPG